MCFTVFTNVPSLVAQMVKCLPTMQETRVQSLGQEDLLEKEMATHSSILAWKIPWMEEPGRLQSMGLQRVGQSDFLSFSLSMFFNPSFCLNGNQLPLRCCNRRDFIELTIYRNLWLGLEKAMAPHSSTLAWKIPWMEEPGRLQSMGSLRVRHN